MIETSENILEYFYEHAIIQGKRPRHGVEYNGVYIIDDVYVGYSNKIKSRLKKHIQDSMRNTHCNTGLMNYIKERVLNNRDIHVTLLNNDITLEGEYIKCFKAKGYKLFNSAIGRGGE